MRAYFGALLIVCALVVSREACAQDGYTAVTDAEWATWPEYCKSRYMTIPGGSVTKWAVTYPRQNIEASKKYLGPLTFDRVHHWCYGLIWLNRAKFEQDVRAKARALDLAHQEMWGAYLGMPDDSVLVAPTYVNIAQMEWEKGNYQAAVESAQQAVARRPMEADGYAALAVFYRKNKQLPAARDILLKGDAALGGKSAEINYNLGLIYLELNDVPHAVERAHTAYELGFPLPGLRNKLRQLGKWEEPARRTP